MRLKKKLLIKTKGADGRTVLRVSASRGESGAQVIGIIQDGRWFCEKVGKATLWDFAHKIAPTIKAVAKATPLVTEGLLVAVLWQESRFDTDAVGRATYMKKPDGEKGAKAKGLAQFMWSTAKAIGISNRFDPRQAIRGQAKLLHQLLVQFDGRYDHALAAYNAGPRAVIKHKGVPPYKETQDYVYNILRHINEIEGGRF